MDWFILIYEETRVLIFIPFFFVVVKLGCGGQLSNREPA